MWPFASDFFYLASCCQASPCCSIYSYFTPFYFQVVFHCMDVPHFIFPFISWWALAQMLNDSSSFISSRRHPWLTSIIELWKFSFFVPHLSEMPDISASLPLCSILDWCCLLPTVPLGDFWTFAYHLYYHWYWAINKMKKKSRIFSKHPCCFHQDWQHCVIYSSSYFLFL